MDSTHDLVLIGGGHSHAIALKKLGMNPIPDLRLTLITNVFHTPYSGMLPGYMAGLYTADECHIDLRPLANFAGARLIVDQAIGLDLENNWVICANHPAIGFDRLSIDIGSTPSVTTIPGVQEYAIPVKPISQFLTYWEDLLADVQARPDRLLRVGVVGGGVGGVELALAAQIHLQTLYRQSGQPSNLLEIHLFHRAPELMPERNTWVRRRMRQIMEQRGIHLHLEETVSAVGPNWVRCESGLEVPCDRLFWVTQASAAPWLKGAGLDTDDRGFIQVNDYLQSTSHPQVFAAGDIATLVNHPRPKAGVFAVRAGAPLTENLRRSLHNKPLKPFRPQKEFLILIGLGDRTAVASRGPLGFGPAPWIWTWKDGIDQKFMNQFTDLEPMGGRMGGRMKDEGGRIKKAAVTRQPTTNNQQPTMPCAGCGSKVGSLILERALHRVRAESFLNQRSDILLGLDAADDAAVVSVPTGQVLVQTVDYFRALVNDPFVFGQIAANHCLSDLFAMGASPQSALAIATLPYATDRQQEETLYHLLCGAAKVLDQTGAVLVGGHTTEGAELAFGLTCNGLADSGRLLKKGGMKPGDVLILNKPLGTGTLFAADMQLRAKGRWIEQALQSMLLSNQAAVEILLGYGATACTDVTGFGLLGHLVEMVRAAQVAVELDLATIPLLEGAATTLAQGYLSSLHPQNFKAATFVQNFQSVRQFPQWAILFDPQTSGGLLTAIPPETVEDCLTELRSRGYPNSAAIGRVYPQTEELPPIRMTSLGR